MKKIKVLTNENEKQNSKNYCNWETNYRQYEQSTQNFKKPITELQIKNQLVFNFEVEVMALTESIAVNDGSILEDPTKTEFHGLKLIDNLELIQGLVAENTKINDEWARKK